MRKNTTFKAFSLIEVLIWVLVVSIIMVAAFQTLSSVWVSKVKIIEKTSIEKDAFFAAEKLFELIKKWWTLDYEEYWNRYNYNTTYGSGYFINPAGFWNFGSAWIIESTTYGLSPYYCRSPNGWSMGTGWCVASNNTFWASQIWVFQRYSQYEEQFIDRNNDGDSDNGDEDGDGNIIWDDDDLFLGIGPEAFTGLWEVGELYLVNENTFERTFFRWNVDIDPLAPSGATCTGTFNMTGSGCLGTIEFLKLTWRDYWFDHANIGSAWDNDGEIDTWMIHDDFLTDISSPVVAGSDSIDYWQSLFSDDIHVKEVDFFIYPNKSIENSWRDATPSLQISPYIQLKITLAPSWKTKRRIRWAIPDVTIRTTIQLSELDFK